jgi:choline kinase
MRALILAAGRGSRLKKYTKNQPKALIKINHTSLLQHQLELLYKNNIKNICIVVGYKSEKIVNFVKQFQKKMKIKIIYNDIYNITDSAYSYYLAKNFVYKKKYLHLNCDILFDDYVLKSIISSKYNVLSCRNDLRLEANMDLIKFCKNRNIISKFDNVLFKEADAKVFGLAKFEKNFSTKIVKDIEKDLLSGDLKKKCFSYLKKYSSKNNIRFIIFNNDNIKEINTKKDYKNYKC